MLSKQYIRDCPAFVYLPTVQLHADRDSPYSKVCPAPDYYDYLRTPICVTQQLRAKFDDNTMGQLGFEVQRHSDRHNESIR